MLADRLWGLGVAGIEERPAGPGRTLLRSSLGEDQDDVEMRLRSVRLGLDDVVFAFEVVDESLADSWRDHVRAIDIDDGLRILPSWLTGESTGLTVRIEPGTTFGLGDHPTTRACLLALRRHLVQGDSILDVGCGSGVLGITSLVCGAQSAIGVDINPAVDTVSRVNADMNGVAAHWQVLVSDVDDALVHDLLTGRPLGFQIVVANILAPVLVAIAPHLRRLIAPGGTLILSGVLTGRYDHVLAAVADLRTLDCIDVDGWTAIVLRQDTSASISSR
ncbi:MAG: 50S ribosomal protein L11 methyltransferase [Actinomycetota bacterium]